MVAVGPRPGNTPITVPIRTPMKTYSTFVGWRATSSLASLHPCQPPDVITTRPGGKGTANTSTKM